jgi:hypothetical protein
MSTKFGFCRSCRGRFHVDLGTRWGWAAGSALAAVILPAFAIPAAIIGAAGGHVLEEKLKASCPTCRVPLQILDGAA